MKRALITLLTLACLFPPALAVAAERTEETKPWIDRYMIYYGKLDAKTIETAKSYELVVLHPHNANLTREQVKAIQAGNNPKDAADDVIVLGYISVGEDSRTYGLTSDQMTKDRRFVGDGTGPRVDPRGPHPNGSNSLEGIDPRGDASPGGAGFASYYLDDNDRDGQPDRNRYFDVAFVNVGDPVWFDLLNRMKLDTDGIAGFGELLTETYGRGLGLNGVFLDTVDTAAPNSYTDKNSGNQTEFEWTAPGYADFLERLRDAYPDKYVMQNRGLFYFDPRLPHYDFNPGEAVDFVLFESYRMNSSDQETFNANFAADNKFNIMPKLMAEANRPGGFQALSLGYAEGPSKEMKEETLTGQSTLGIDLLKQDIVEAEQVAGFRHYITNAYLTVANSFVAERGSLKDAAPPAWSSVYNDSPVWPPKSVAPRVGIQEAVALPQGVKVRWDIALDLHPVTYTLYYQESPFDFAKDPNLTKAKRLTLTPSVAEGYGKGDAKAYPYEATVRGLKPGTTYYFAIRAKDASAAANEEKNDVVLKVQTMK
ncbi:hypothetical protein [Paenibacillus sp.]|uniref:hypothetical protein n=1 Tax=Paenibacillus sp. TaxID=58172 RepID=UPI002811418D|nr:hypothetical protein [Paenibacillus sp.]